MKNKILKAIYLIFAFLFLINAVSCNNFNLANDEYEKNSGNLRVSSEDNIIYYDWIQTWTENYYSQCYAMTLDNLNNIYLGGSTHVVNGNEETCFIKYNSAGIQQFNVTWSGSSTNDECYAIGVDSLYNIYIAGYKDEGGHYVIYLAKFNSTGYFEWNRTWNGVSGWGTFTKGIALDSSNNIYIVGEWHKTRDDSEIVLIKYNSTGDEQWYRLWGGTSNDEGGGIAIDTSDNIYVVGSTYSFGSGKQDICLVKYDNNGVELWNRTWGGIDEEFGCDITFDSLNNIYLAGSSESYGNGSYDFTLVKFDSSGNFQWYQTFGGSGDEFARCMSCDSSDNIYIGGSRGCNIGIVKYNNSGGIELNATWGLEGVGQGVCYYDDYCYGIEFDSSDNLYIGGFVEGSHIYLMKSDSEFGIGMVEEQLFVDDIEFSTTFSTSLEKDPILNLYSDETHTVSVSFRITGYENYFIIALYDTRITDNIKIIAEPKGNQNETIITIHLYEELNFSYNYDLLYRFYFNYTYTYEYCTEFSGDFCQESDYTSRSGSYLSDNHIITRNGISLYTSESSIPINPILVFGASIIGVLLGILFFQKHKKDKK